MRIHLNGGPKDDQELNIPDSRRVFYVARNADLTPRGFYPDGLRAERTVEGNYFARFDGLGQLVPHDRAGTVEFDWQGWTS